MSDNKNINPKEKEVDLTTDNTAKEEFQKKLCQSREMNFNKNEGENSFFYRDLSGGFLGI